MGDAGDNAPLPPGLYLDSPGLLPSLPDAAVALLADDLAPRLEDLLGRAQRSTSGPFHSELHRLREAVTGAVVAYAADLEVGPHCWYQAAPLQLLPDRDTLIIAGPASLELGHEESRGLIDVLNSYLSSDEHRFFLTESGDWLLRTRPDIATLRLPDIGLIEGRRLSDCLPAKDDASDWIRWFNEMQMLLHGSPVSEARALHGLPRVNGLWIWRGGKLPEHPRLGWDRVFSTDLSVRGLAKLADRPYAPAASATAAIDAASAGEAVLVSLPEAPLVRDGAGFSAWEDWLRSVDASWGEPLFRALQGGLLPGVRISAGDEREWTCRPGDRRRFWRRRRRLRDHLARRD